MRPESFNYVAERLDLLRALFEHVGGKRSGLLLYDAPSTGSHVFFFVWFFEVGHLMSGDLVVDCSDLSFHCSYLDSGRVVQVPSSSLHELTIRRTVETLRSKLKC